jgi:serine phosphatase RsbU (regulator of sigma subunit)
MALTEGRMVLPRAAEIHVLLVEDDDGDAFLVEELFSHPTNPQPTVVRFVRARTVAQAVELCSAGAQDSRVDCILLDLGLPDSIGLDGLHRLLALVPQPPIVVLTGHTDASHGVAAVAAGAQDYVVKGQVTGGTLARVLQYAIERRRAQAVTAELQTARLHEQENRRLERGLLPTPLLSDPHVFFAARYEPGHQQLLLGGDFYDVVETSDATLHLLIGDVSGHGVDEAALGVLLRIAWRTLVLAGIPGQRIPSILQRVFVSERHQRRLFTTLAMATINPSRDELQYWLAGHPPPLLITNTGCRLLPDHARGLPLGVQEDARWLPHAVALPETWAVLLCTDGLFEGSNKSGDGQLWLDGLLELTENISVELGGLERWRYSPEDLLAALISQVKVLDPNHTDDLAALMLSHIRSGVGQPQAGPVENQAT